ncbi:Na+/H+ antiporter subunit G [Ruegeria sp. TM1040]|jgi:multicomponent K+:H+ antiporter subunit G|uniref:Na+/H+ antiporter subunit G n=1 Tax=Rhodobacterales TaxID=204455 RepID=UPI00004623D8|nr:Na+/H+ antiporter subunit G [Ruegeria sp. TM1040]ABF64276.1 Na+/H+ antiporter subunit [Ruegeria sp. TM1040]
MIAEILITAFIALGGIFGFVGSFGLLKLNDPMSRMHAPTKATTLGVGGVLLGSMLHAIVVEGRISAHELLITLFLLITAPVTANFLAKVFINQQTQPKDLPVPGDCKLWATHNKPEHHTASSPDA